MLKRIAIITATFGLAVLAVAAPQAARAQLMGGDSGQSATVRSDQTIDDDLYITGKDVLVEGTVNGDVYAAGSSVTIRGTVNGDVIAAGSDVLIGGTVKGSVRAAGSTVRISNANIGGSASAFGSSITLEKDSQVGGGMNFAGATIALRGPVARSVVGAGSSVILANTVGKDTDLAASDVTLESSAVINGHLNYYGKDVQLHRDPNAQVKGEVKHIEGQRHAQNDNRTSSAFAILWGLISLYLVGALLLWAAPGPVAAVSATVQRRPGASLGVGALAFVLLLPVLIVLLITVIGIPLAVLLALAFGVLLYLAKFFVSLAVGGMIARRTEWKPNPYADVLIGLLLITLLELIPGVGWIVRILVAIAGLGAVILSLIGRSTEAEPKAPAKPKPTPTKRA